MTVIESTDNNVSSILEKEKKNLKQDLLFLKDDILKDFREIESKLTTKFDKQNSNVKDSLEKFETIINGLNNKVVELSNLIFTDKTIQEKVNQLTEFKTKTEEDLVAQNVSIKNVLKDLNNAKNNYDKILSLSILYPGIIGNNCKFESFHQFIDYVLLNISQLSTYKDKNNIDLKGYKTKMESLVKSFKIQGEALMANTSEYTKQKIE